MSLAGIFWFFLLTMGGLASDSKYQRVKVAVVYTSATHFLDIHTEEANAHEVRKLTEDLIEDGFHFVLDWGFDPQLTQGLYNILSHREGMGFFIAYPVNFEIMPNLSLPLNMTRQCEDDSVAVKKMLRHLNYIDVYLITDTTEKTERFREVMFKQKEDPEENLNVVGEFMVESEEKYY
eukprot:CAMPEP_0114993528 /NCGR_PEP_ID=MMETSP0216-20121206/12583_1 /TAXON_ID=223996 /ORGANISM="Protocruzia adherens, Strain Boccale" /LENGTH=177 /DNA_ID=CAMNT_0002357187 /DNA_START=36 /DNA_END=569 /DNA_ORIENTATION=+